MDAPLSNVDIAHDLRNIPGFSGVYSYDLLPSLRDRDFCVVNTDNVKPIFDQPEGGHHWLTVCREKRTVLVFDSFGRTLRQMEVDYTEPHLERFFLEAYPDCRLYTNTQVLQHVSTAVCGHYAILMGKLFSSLGIDGALKELKLTFADDKLENDRRVLIGGGLVGSGDDDDWTKRLAMEMHKPRRVRFPRRRVIVHGIDDIWSADLVDMQAFSKFNNGVKFLLTVIDLFSRYAWIVPLTDKTGRAVTDAFQNILHTSGRRPKKLWVDEGKEFYNRTLKKWLNENRIHMYSTHNEGKAVVVERFNRTMKTRMWRHFTAKSTSTYLDVLPKLVGEYNNKAKHRVIGMTPAEASRRENERWVRTAPQTDDPPARARFKIGDRVRIAVMKRHFEKGYTPNWTEEVFIIDQVLRTSPLTYRIRDLMDEHIQGSFYEQQLQKAVQDKFRIEKVLRKRRGQVLVKWKGYSDKFNTWLSASDAQKL